MEVHDHVWTKALAGHDALAAADLIPDEIDEQTVIDAGARILAALPRKYLAQRKAMFEDLIQEKQPTGGFAVVSALLEIALRIQSQGAIEVERFSRMDHGFLIVQKRKADWRIAGAGCV